MVISLKQSMILAGQNLISMLSPDHDYLPYFWMKFDADKRAKMQMRWASHNVGRWWDAILRLESITDFEIPPRVESAMLLNLQLCLKGPLGVCRHLPEDCAFDGHSHREIFLALACLVRYRNSKWAKNEGARLIDKLDSLILKDCSWDLNLMRDLSEKAGTTIDHSLKYFNEHPLATHGRMIEGLMEFYIASGVETALILAERLSKFHFDHSTNIDGSVPVAEYVHTHSLFGLYRGLLIYGTYTNQQKYIDRVLVSFNNTVRPNFKPSGFISHDWGRNSKGETAAAGDAAQIGLWLTKINQGNFYDECDRWVRARILPSQITEIPNLIPQENTDADEYLKLGERALGAFGGMHTHPHGGKLSTFDITAADLHSLCDIYSNIIEIKPCGVVVNFHFDYEDSQIIIKSTTSDTRILNIVSTRFAPVWVRTPGWTHKENIKIIIEAIPTKPIWIGEYLYFDLQNVGLKIQIEYDLPKKITEEIIDNLSFQIKWKGNEIIGIHPNTDFFPFYRNLNNE